MAHHHADGEECAECNMIKGDRIDIYRDTPIRYLGYANEVGESFRQLVSVGLVRLSYVVSTGYCLADAVSKGLEERNIVHVASCKKTSDRIGFETFLEAAVWQGLASVIIPGFTVNRICWFSGMMLRRGFQTLLCAERQKVAVLGIGLVSIPFIIHPIDKGVDYVMDRAVPSLKEVTDKY